MLFSFFLLQPPSVCKSAYLEIVIRLDVKLLAGVNEGYYSVLPWITSWIIYLASFDDVFVENENTCAHALGPSTSGKSAF